ncbi:MAG: preprotein translocase subunit SecG [Gammaproteobacteria bacterium]|jgi:preprotein translocase subunit SecG
MYEIFLVVYLVIAIALIGFILLQKSKGAGMGASFGAGASGTVFGSSGSGNFLTKTTTLLAIGFFGVALALGNMTSNREVANTGSDLFTEEDLKPANESEMPAAAPQTEIPAEIPAATTTETEIPVPTEEDAEEVPEKKDEPSS